MSHDFNFLGMQRNKFGKVSRESSGCCRLAHSDDYRVSCLNLWSEEPLIKWMYAAILWSCVLAQLVRAQTSFAVAFTLFAIRFNFPVSECGIPDLLYGELGIGQKESVCCRIAFYYSHLKLTVVAQWLRCCAINRKFAGSIPAGVSGIYHWHKILPSALWP